MSPSPRNRLDVFKSELVRGAQFSAMYEFPMLEAVEYKPTSALPFEKAYRTKKSAEWVHFYTHDRHFECIWNNPERYLPLFRRFSGVITPDFSLYLELPLSMQIWNTYRNRAIAYWLQREGFSIVPNVRWGDERSYDFAFEGVPIGGTVALGTHGCVRKKADQLCFQRGLDRMVHTLQPNTLVVYGASLDGLFDSYARQGISVIIIPSHVSTLRQGAA